MYMLCIHCKIANKSKIHWFRVFWPKTRFPVASLLVSTRPIGQTISPIGPTSKGQSNSPLPNGPVPFGPPPSPRQARSSLLLDLDRRWRQLERAGRAAGQRPGAEARPERRPASRAAGRGGGADPGRQRYCGTAAGRAPGAAAAGRARPAAALWLCGRPAAAGGQRQAAGCSQRLSEAAGSQAPGSSSTLQKV